MPYSPHLNEMENHSNMENEREGEQGRERVKTQRYDDEEDNREGRIK